MLLSYPPSTNRYWRRFGSNTVVSAEAKAYKAEAKMIALCAREKLQLSDVHLIVKLHPKAKKDGSASAIVLDLDNCLKVAIDALQGICYANDNQVKRISAEYGAAMSGGGLSVEVRGI